MAITVLVMTYNHERYIRRALDSALGQQTTVPFEILISEDCSTDGTREVVEEYARRHPGRIRLLLSSENLHSNEVVARGFRAARGRYLAPLDGDDYWTADDKLQTQFDFLEAHPDFTMCFHDVDVVDSDARPAGRTWNRPDQRPVIGLDRIVRGNPIALLSVMYRRRAVAEIPAWYATLPLTDWPLHVLYAERGKIGYVARVMGAYRMHDHGSFSRLSQIERLETQAVFYRRMRACVHPSLERELRRGQFEYFSGWTETFRRHGDRGMARRCLRWAWDARSWRQVRPLGRLLLTAAMPMKAAR